MTREPRGLDLREMATVLRRVEQAIEVHTDEPAHVVAAVRQLLDCDASSQASRRCGLGVAFGRLASWNPVVARGLEWVVFGGAADGPDSPAWQAWLVLSNPLLPAAGILRPRYRAALEYLPGAASLRQVAPALDPTCRLGVHLLLLVLFAPDEFSDFSGFAERFLLEADPPRVAAALQAASLAASRALDTTALDRLEQLLSHTSRAHQATHGRRTLLLFGPGGSHTATWWGGEAPSR